MMKKTMKLAGLGLAFRASRAAGNENTKSGLQAYSMKALLALFLLMVATITASAQKSTVLGVLSKHGIDTEILRTDKTKQPDNYAFNFKQTTIAADKQTVTIAKFDPSKTEEERWTVVSVNGKSPSRSDINSFRKNQNKESTSAQPDEPSYKIEKETPNQLVISYKLDPGSLNKENAFMKDCRFYMTINLKTKKLEQVQALNEKPIKVKILKAEKFDLIVKYIWNEEAKHYFSASEDLHMEAKFIGQAANVQTLSEYSNYVKK